MNIYADSVLLPSCVKIKVGDELIWSASSGRTATGLFVGDVVANKKTIEIEWQYITETQLATIASNMSVQGFTFAFRDNGADTTLTSCYRDTLQKDYLGSVGDGNIYYRSVSVSKVQM